MHILLSQKGEGLAICGVICKLVHGNAIPMGIPWETSHGMGWDRHKLLWGGNGTDMSLGQPGDL